MKKTKTKRFLVIAIPTLIVLGLAWKMTMTGIWGDTGEFQAEMQQQQLEKIASFITERYASSGKFPSSQVDIDEIAKESDSNFSILKRDVHDNDLQYTFEPDSMQVRACGKDQVCGTGDDTHKKIEKTTAKSINDQRK